MKPHPVVISLLTQVEDVIPRWKIVPTKDVIDAAFKDPAKREKVRAKTFAVFLFLFCVIKSVSVTFASVNIGSSPMLTVKFARETHMMS